MLQGEPAVLLTDAKNPVTVRDFISTFEGSKLTDRKVERLLANLEIKRFTSRDEQEVAGYDVVMKTIFQSWTDIPITENYIKQLHRDLLRHNNKDERHRGEYKTLRNDVRAFDADGKMIGIVLFEAASPFDMPQRMQELVIWQKGTHELARFHPRVTSRDMVRETDRKPEHAQSSFHVTG